METIAKWYRVEVARPPNIIECEVEKDALLDAEPYAGVVPYTISEVAAWLVFQVIVAPVALIVVAIEEMVGGEVVVNV